MTEQDLSKALAEELHRIAPDVSLEDIDPTEDNRGPVAFKNHVAGIILRRAIASAWSRA